MRCGICKSKNGYTYYSIPREKGSESIKKRYPKIRVCEYHYTEYCEKHPEYKIKEIKYFIKRLKKEKQNYDSKDWIEEQKQSYQRQIDEQLKKLDEWKLKLN